MTNAEIRTEIVKLKARIAFLERQAFPKEKRLPKKRVPTDYTEQILSKLYKNEKSNRQTDRSRRAARTLGKAKEGRK